MILRTGEDFLTRGFESGRANGAYQRLVLHFRACALVY